MNALQISLWSVWSICIEREKYLPLQTQGKNKKKCKRKAEDLLDGVKAAVRKFIYDMKKNGKHINIKIVDEKLKRKAVIHISNASLGWLLGIIEFKYKT